MDLKSVLKPGDLFVHYWLTDRLAIILGDSEDVHAAEFVQIGELIRLIGAFEMQVSRVEYYANFINEQQRPEGWPSPAQLPVPLLEVLNALSTILIPESLRDRCRRGDYRRLDRLP